MKRLDPIEMLRRDEATLIPCAGCCGFKLDPRAGSKPGDKCLLCEPGEFDDSATIPLEHFNCRSTLA